MQDCEHFRPVAADRVFRLFNYGGVYLFGGAEARFPDFEGLEGWDADLMPIQWASPCALNRVAVMAAHGHYTTGLVERTGVFSLIVPSPAIVQQVVRLGVTSKARLPAKLEESRIELRMLEEHGVPTVEGALACAVFRLIPEAETVQKACGLIVGECVAAWADERSFAGERWLTPEESAPEQRPLFYSAGGDWYVEAARAQLVVTGERHPRARKGEPGYAAATQ